MGEKLFRVAGTLSMMVIAIVLIVMLIVLVIGCVGGTFVVTAITEALYELTVLTPMPY